MHAAAGQIPGMVATGAGRERVLVERRSGTVLFKASCERHCAEVSHKGGMRMSRAAHGEGCSVIHARRRDNA